MVLEAEVCKQTCFGRVVDTAVLIQVGVQPAKGLLASPVSLSHGVGVPLLLCRGGACCL